MSARCIGLPVSWLRLERRALGELPERERAEIDEHLRGCPACAACAARIEAEATRLLPSLPAVPATAASPATPAIVAPPPIRSRARWLGERRTWLFAGGGLAAAAALMLLLLQRAPRPAPDGDVDGAALASLPPARVRIKGGELALVLVRERDGVVTEGADRFRPGDRWKALVTCSPALDLGPEARVELTVRQAGQTYRPLGPPAPLACANRQPLAGAFALDGAQPAAVCVTVSATSEAPLSLCSRLDPAPSPPAPITR